jgi:formylglycine-generating enzyme required for sulfatase activity
MTRTIQRVLLWLIAITVCVQSVYAAEPNFSVTTGNDKLGPWCDLHLGSATMRLRELPAGSFWMGSPAEEIGRYSDEPRHQVTLSRAFAIGQFEVTQAEWKAAMGGLPKVYSGTIKGPPRGPDAADRRGRQRRARAGAAHALHRRGNPEHYVLSAAARVRGRLHRAHRHRGDCRRRAGV